MSLHSRNNTRRPVVFVGHDASRTGAPIVLLQLLRWLKEHTELPLRVVLMNGGDLAAEFAAVAPTVTLTEISVGRSRLVRKIGRIPLLGSELKKLWHRFVTPRIVEQQPSLVYANTVATGRLLHRVVPAGVPVIVHVHELERAIQIAAGSEGMSAIKSLAHRYVAVSDSVQENLITNHGVDKSLIEMIPAFIAIDESIIRRAEAYRQTMRRAFQIPLDAVVVGGCGATGWRKGVDLFVKMARAVDAMWSRDPVHFVWVGRVADDDFTRSSLARIQEWGLAHLCHFVGEHTRPVELFCGFDVFALTSREDPMPLVALEAASVGIPIVCFAGTGGIPDFVSNECGTVVSKIDANAMAEATIEILSSSILRKSFGQRAFQKVREFHRVDTAGTRILKVIEQVANSNG